MISATFTPLDRTVRPRRAKGTKPAVYCGNDGHDSSSLRVITIAVALAFLVCVLVQTISVGARPRSLHLLTGVRSDDLIGFFLRAASDTLLEAEVTSVAMLWPQSHVGEDFRSLLILRWHHLEWGCQDRQEKGYL